ncbi:MAG: tRNA (guanosine(46)-N7)-methyltransferase TrmB [Pseudomonadota bacterium]
MTPAQERAYEEGWARWGIAFQPQLLDEEQLFRPGTPRIVEIGFGMGQSLLNTAAAHPDRSYLGIEVHRPGVGKLLMGVLAQSLDNVRVMCHDAVEIFEQCLAPKTLDAVHIFFPDPWPKKKHHKRRLIQPAFVELLASRLKATGHIHLATDWEPYAEHMIEVLECAPSLRNRYGAGSYAPRPDDRPETKFEARGRRLGHGVWDLIYELSPDAV